MVLSFNFNSLAEEQCANNIAQVTKLYTLISLLLFNHPNLGQ